MLAKLLAGLLRKPENITLQHFRIISMSDSPDGFTPCVDGWNWTLLIYRDRVVGRIDTLKVRGATELRSRNKDDFWWQMSDVAKCYMNICKILQTKQRQGNESEATDAGWDEVWILPEVLETLRGHPQFQELLNLPGFKLTPVARNNAYKVEVI